MQIIIVQNEIEEAIRNHILNQINIRENMRIDIDLSATRGAAGFTATINIVRNDAERAPAAEQPTPTPTPQPETQPTETAKPAVTRTTAKRNPAPVGTSTGQAAASTNVVEEPATTLGSDNSSDDAGSQEDAIGATLVTGSDDGVIEQTGEVAPTEPAPTPTPPPAGKSLFGNVNRPVNS